MKVKPAQNLRVVRRADELCGIRRVRNASGGGIL